MGKFIIIFLFLHISAFGAVVVYENDFDNPAMTQAGVTGSVSGGTQGQGGIQDSQGLDNLATFSGDFFRVAAANDPLTIQMDNLDTSTSNSIAFSLAMLDSWDGSSGQYGTDIFTIQIFDGDAATGTQIGGFSLAYSNVNSFNPYSEVTSIEANSVQLGFNNGSQSWWRDDAVSVNFEDLVASTGTLTFSIFGSSGGTGSGFQGGNDESFGIDNFTVTSNIPEPSSFILLMPAIVGLLFMRKRTFTVGAKV